jgi:hypothetical protein
MGKDHERGSRPGRCRMIANDVISMRIWKHNMEVEKGGEGKRGIVTLARPQVKQLIMKHAPHTTHPYPPSGGSEELDS